MKKSISLITALTVSLFSFSTMSSSGASAKANEQLKYYPYAQNMESILIMVTER